MPITNIFPDPANQSAVLNETFTIVHQGATPSIVWLLFGVAALCLLSLSFIFKLRDERGSVNPTRIAFSLIGTVISGCAAFLSLSVDVPMGVGSIVADNVSTIVSMHSVYELPMISGVFVLIGLLCFSNFVYCLIAPEMLKPDGELEGKKKQKKEVEKDEG